MITVTEKEILERINNFPTNEDDFNDSEIEIIKELINKKLAYWWYVWPHTILCITEDGRLALKT